jgi:hypothetical protein
MYEPPQREEGMLQLTNAGELFYKGTSIGVAYDV